MQTPVFLLITLLLAAQTQAQRTPAATRYATGKILTIHYNEDTTDFPNPERGFYMQSGTMASQFQPLTATGLTDLYNPAHLRGNPHYSFHSTLLLRGYTLDTFKSQPLSQAFLDLVDQDLAVVRNASLKVILRFAYTNDAKTGNCPDIYKICPPYGDAPKAIVLQHIAQLAPILKKNADIIAVLQEGFIGIWGENFYTDYFGDPGKNGPGRVMDSSWNDRNEVLKALLSALPADRMVQVRTPQYKQKAVYGPEATIESPPLTEAQAFNGTPAARIAYHNDCFLSSPDDYGTYYDYGSSHQPQREANMPLRRYAERDSRYVAVGGETCDDAYSPQNDCEPVGHAEQEMTSMHYSFLNASYNNDVNNDWDSLGCISSIRRRLGYRFTLRTGRFPATATAGKTFAFTLQLDNIGYASPYNPRPVVLIFRNKATGRETALATHADPRTWFTGPRQWTDALTLPASLPAGNYELLLSLPDKYASLANNPRYAIRLANNGCWEPATGFNRLGVTVTVK